MGDYTDEQYSELPEPKPHRVPDKAPSDSVYVYYKCRCPECREAHNRASRERTASFKDGTWTDRRKRSDTLLLEAIDRSNLTREQLLALLTNNGAAPQFIAGRVEESHHERQHEPDPAVPVVTDAQPSRTVIQAEPVIQPEPAVIREPVAAIEEDPVEKQVRAATARMLEESGVMGGVTPPTRPRPAPPVPRPPVTDPAGQLLKYVKSLEFGNRPPSAEIARATGLTEDQVRSGIYELQRTGQVTIRPDGSIQVNAPRPTPAQPQRKFGRRRAA